MRCCGERALFVKEALTSVSQDYKLNPFKEKAMHEASKYRSIDLSRTIQFSKYIAHGCGLVRRAPYNINLFVF